MSLWDRIGKNWSNTWRNDAGQAALAATGWGMPVASSLYALEKIIDGGKAGTSSGSVGSSAYNRPNITDVVGNRSRTSQPEMNRTDFLSEMYGINQGALDNALASILNGGAMQALGSPQDMTDQWLAKLGDAYGPQISHAQSVIPYMENQQDVNSQEIQHLYNIAEQTLNESAGNIRTSGQEADAAATANIADIIAAVDATGEGQQTDYMEELTNLGIADTAGDAIPDMAREMSQLIGAEGGLYTNAMAQDTETNAQYVDTLASLQDSAAAGTVAELANNVAGRIFEQQGRIAELQGAQAAAEMDVLMSGRADYMDQLQLMQGSQNDALNAVMAVQGLKMDQGNAFQSYMNPEVTEEYSPAVDSFQLVDNLSSFIQRETAQNPVMANQMANAVFSSLQSGVEPEQLIDEGIPESIVRHAISELQRIS